MVSALWHLQSSGEIEFNPIIPWFYHYNSDKCKKGEACDVMRVNNSGDQGTLFLAGLGSEEGETYFDERVSGRVVMLRAVMSWSTVRGFL